MLLARSNFKRMAVAAAALVPICLVLALQANTYSANARLQELADSAALAGVNSLASSAGQPDSERRATSIAIARDVVSARPNTVSEIKPSPESSKMSVVVRDTALGKQASSAATYLPPSAGAPTRHTSNMVLPPSPGAM